MTATIAMVAATTAKAADVNQNFAELGMLANGYAEAVADQGTFTAQTDLTGLTVTVNISAAFAAAGRKIRITGYVQFSSTVATDTIAFALFEGASQLYLLRGAMSGTFETYTITRTVTPTAGNHTYKLTGQRNGGTGNITMRAAANFPAFILVEAI